MQAIVLAGGSARRLHAPTASVPKPMLPLFDRPLMEHCITLLASQGITDVIVTLSHLAHGLSEYFGDGSRFGVKIRYSLETEPMGTAGALKLVQPMVNDTFVVISGDAITDADIRAAVGRHRSASAIATVLLSYVDDPTEFGVVQRDPAGKITRFVEKPRSDEAFDNTVSTGIYILEPEVLSCIPYHRPYDFARELIPSMLNNQEPIYGFHLPGYWCDAGNLAQYRNAHFDALEGRLKIELPAAHIGQGVWMGERVELHNSVELTAPVYLGSGAVIRRGASIGMRTVIGEDTLVDEGARVSRSVIGGGSVIGRDSTMSDCIVSTGYTLTGGQQTSDLMVVEPAYYTSTRVAPTPVRTETRTPAAPRERQAGKALGVG